MVKKIVLLLSGNVMTSVILFLRTILIARLISVADYGIAATFMISVTIMQLLSNLGLNQMIIQDNDGDDPDFQASLQGFQLLRGFVSGALLFALAAPMARFLGQPQITWAYQLLAVVPVLNGLAHFDVFRLQRRMAYGPFIATQLLPPLISVLAIWPLYMMYGDYRVMLGAILAQWLLYLLLTHLVKERRYALAFRRDILMRGVRFGWPLLANGVMLFIIYQGERLVVGRELGMATLAIFSMTLSLVQTPMGAVTRAVHQFLLPQLSAAKADDGEFNRMAVVMVQASALAMAVLALGIALAGPPLVLLALGEKYAPVLDFLLLMAVVELLRAVRSGLSQVALARARTLNGVVSNLPRVLAIAVAWALLIQGAGLPAVLGVAVLGEALGFIVALVLAHRWAGMAVAPQAPCLIALALFAAALALASPLLPWTLPPLVEAGLLALTGGALLATLRPLWRYLRDRRMTAYGG
ncbi:oligosaccharide flippase family protein [Meridianimarinicoccus sp. MJW13]|uniref:oligosaccharide flippase family protein n=1 Tax=Meridianimarinicoccus sp. MJW13 TaxID=2720031 RepID=UPI0018688ABB|nr:oligosaccharide flippase family protein [Fluviibacterium sp. MJW13]